MGDPGKTRKKYNTPSHPWVGSRIIEERALKQAYGTKSKKEIYKMTTALKVFKDQAKSLASRTDNQAKIEHEQMITKMISLGLISVSATLDDILSLSINDVMNRRLQTVMVKKLLARTVKQARQLITHGHVLVDSKVITSPSYLVKTTEEGRITFRQGSAFVSETHPERFSEAELEMQKERTKAKTAKKSGDETEEVPPTFDEKDLEDPEELGKDKVTPKEAPVVPKPAPETEVAKEVASKEVVANKEEAPKTADTKVAVAAEEVTKAVAPKEEVAKEATPKEAAPLTETKEAKE